MARKAEFFFFWPRLPRKSGLGTNMAEKAGLLWPRLPRKLGRGQVCQALPGRIFLVSLAKNPESPAWPGFARLAGFLRLFFLFFLELNFSFFRHFVYLHLGISYPVLLTLFAVAAILNTSPSSLETRDLLCARVFSRAAAILKSEKTLGTRLSFLCQEITGRLRGSV